MPAVLLCAYAHVSLLSSHYLAASACIFPTWHCLHRHSAWVHVDAAYAGCAAVCPQQREEHFGGLDRVDSYSFNPQ